MNRSTVVFRADASVDIGIGHVMRCLTLADALQARGAHCSFVCRSVPGHQIDAIAGPFGPAQGDNFNDLLDQQAERYVQELHGTYVTAYEGLTELQRAVLTRVLSHGANGQLFTAQALAQYSQAHGRQVLPGAARSAVEKLRDLDPPLIWKSARGDYAPEDSGMRAWYEDLVANGAWPPT